MYKILAITLSLAALAGCASSKKIVLPNGNVGFNIECNGTAVSMSKCYQKAGEVCPNGYSVMSSHNNSGAMSDFKGGSVPTSHKGLMVLCK